MNKKIVILLIIMSISIQYTFSDKINSHSIEAIGDDLYFKDNVKILVKFSVTGGHYRVYVDGYSRSRKKGVPFPYSTGSFKHYFYCSTTTDLNYKIKHEYFNIEKSGTLKVYKDNIKPAITDNIGSSKYFNSTPNLEVSINDTANYTSSCPDLGTSLKELFYKVEFTNLKGQVKYLNNISAANLIVGYNNCTKVSITEDDNYKLKLAQYINSLTTNERNGDYKITVHALDQVSNRTVYNKEFTIDNTSPSLTIKQNIIENTSEPVILTAVTSDIESGIVKTLYRYHSKDKWKTGSPVITENKIVYFKTRNGSGLTTYVNHSVSNIDNSVPTIEVISSNENWTNKSVVITAKSRDLESGIVLTEYSYDSVNWFEGYKINISENKDIYFRAVNGVGLNSGVIMYKVENIDTVQPLIEILDNSDESQVFYEFKYKISDNNQILKNIIYVNNMPVIPSIIGDIYSVLLNNKLNNVYVDGDNEILVNIEDMAGNKNSFNQTIRLDNTPPNIEVKTKPLGYYKQFNYEFTITDNNKISIVKVLQNGIEVIPIYNGLNSYSVLINYEGINFIEIFSKDYSGNRSTINEQIFIDNTPPALIDNITDSYHKTFDYIYTISDNIKIDNHDIYINKILKKPTQIDNNKFLIKFSESGIFEVELNIKDTSGNILNVTKEIKIDNVRPTIDEITTPIKLYSHYYYKFNVSDNILVNDVICLINNKEVTYVKNINNEYVLDIFNNGINEVQITATDSVGNKITKNQIVNIDSIAPKIITENPILGDEIFITEYITLKDSSLIATDLHLSKIKFSFNIEDFRQIIGPIKLSDHNIVDGVNTINIAAFDKVENKTIRSFNFIKDTTIPVINFIDLKFNNNLEDTKANSSITFIGVDRLELNEDKLEYKTDDEFNKLIISEPIFLSADIPDGKFNVTVRLTDKVGFSTDFVKQFIIDRISPDIQTVEISLFENNNGETSLLEDSITASNNLQLVLTNSSKDIDIPRYEYFLTKLLPSNMNYNKDNYTKYNNNSVLDFKDGGGLYYLYVYLFDDAGNRSENYTYKTIRINNKTILPPKVTGYLKANYITDVTTLNNITFKISPDNSNNSLAFVNKYRYQLYKGILAPEQLIIDSEITNFDGGITLLNLNSLKDNLTDEYYFLKVRALTNSKQQSEFSLDHKFRIDTTPPQNLLIQSQTHPDSDQEYSHGEIELNWQKPTDMTGVKKYEYYISNDNNTFIEGNVLITRVGNSCFIRLALTKDEIIGDKYVKVIATDYGDKQTEDLFKLKYNRSLPIINITDIEKDLDTLSSIITWDVIGNIESQKIIINQEDKFYSILLDKKIRSYNIDGLVLNKKYKVSISTFTDTIPVLQNISSQSFTFNNDINDNELDYVDFIYNIDGFKVYGEQHFNSNEKSAASIVVPGYINKINNLELTNLKFNQTFDYGENFDAYSDIDINGFNIKSSMEEDFYSGLYIDSLLGVNLINRFIKFTTENDELKLLFENIHLSSSINPIINSSIYEVSTPVTINSKVNINKSWILNNVSIFKLFNSRLLITAAITDFINYENLNITSFIDNISTINISNSLLTHDGSFISSKIDDELLLKWGPEEVKLKVLDSELVADNLHIKDAELLFEDEKTAVDENGNSINVYLKNLIISRNGVVINNPDDITPFYIKHNNEISFYINKLTFDDNHIQASGEIISNENRSYFNNLQINGNGISPNAQGNIDNDITYQSKSGFFLYAKKHNIKITNKGFLLENCDIDLSSFQQGLTSKIYNTVISFTLENIIQDGYSFDELTINYSDNEIYKIKEIVLTDNNLVAKKLSVNLSKFFNNIEIDIFNSNMRIDEQLDVGFIQFGYVDENISKLKLRSGFDLQFSEIYYNNGILVIPESKILLPEGSPNNALNIMDLESDQINTTYTILENSINYSHNNWNFNIYKPKITDLGISGDTEIEIILLGDKQQIKLHEFNMKYNGDIILSNFTSMESEITVYGFNAITKGINIINDELIFDNISIFNRSQNFDIQFNDINFNNKGELLSELYSNSKVVFTSNNGFKVQSDTIYFDNEKMFSTGSIYLPENLNPDKVVNFSNSPFEITSSWIVLSKTITVPITIYNNGISISIIDYFFTDEGIYIQSGIVEIDAENSIKIENVLLNKLGEEIYSGNIKQSKNISIAGWNMDIDSISFESDGITLSGNVILPEDFSDTTIYLDDIKLTKDNDKISFTSNTTINNLSLTIFDMAFDFKTIKLTSESIKISNSTIKLPDGDIFGGEIISFNNIEIFSSGAFNIVYSNSEPLNIFGLDLYINNLIINENNLEIEGSVQFPSDFFVEELRDFYVDINKFNYNMNTKEIIFELQLEDIEVEIADGWVTTISDINIDNDGINIGQGLIYFPTDWLDNISVESTGFKNLSLDFSSKEFSIEEIFFNNIEVDIENYNFTITTGSYSETEGFTFGGIFPLTGLFNGEDSPPVITVHKLQINNDYRIKELDATFEGENLSLTANKELLFSGNIRTSITEDDIDFDLSGVLVLGNTFLIEDMQADTLVISEFKYNLTNNKIKSLNAMYESSEKRVLDSTISDFVFSINYVEDTPINFTLGGNIILPETFPGIGGEIFSVNGQFDSLGNILVFDSELTITEDKQLVDNLILKSGSNISITPNIESINSNNILESISFSLNSAVIEFDENFSIEKLQGSKIITNELTINSFGGFESCDLTYSLTEQFEIFPGYKLKNGTISLLAPDNNDIKTTISGSIILPESFGDTELLINNFTIHSDGTIDVDISRSDIDTIIFEKLHLTNGELSVLTDIDNDLLFNISGDLQLVDTNLPSELTNSKLSGDIVYSANNGFTSMNIGLTSGELFKYEVVDGLTLELEDLSVDSRGIAAQGTLTIEDGFVGVLGNTKTRGYIFIDWDGEIIESEITLEELEIEYADMKCVINNISFDKDGLSFTKGIITLPSSLGNQKIDITDGGIDNTGKFYGDVNVEKLDIDLLGCKISLYSPEIDSDNNQISCSKSELVLPVALGSASIVLNDVKIDSNGLSISGGEFELPDINTGALTFKDMSALLAISGDDYEISASGKVFVASIGEVEAKISLVNISNPDYPIGLKYAYFGFEADIGGLPLGTTGLLLTGLRGGLAFGPPGDDLEEYIRDKFTSGMRIELGVTITNVEKTVTGKSDFWLNTTNLDFALKGELEYLDGLFTAYSTAIYTKSYGLELIAGLEIDFFNKIYLEGTIRAHLFDEDDKTRFCGEAYVDVSVQDILFGFPEDPMSLGRLGIEVGDFNDDRQGFKGYIELNILGSVGFFIGSDGYFDVGDVEEYTLLDSSEPNSNRLVYRTFNRIQKRSNRVNKRIIFCLEYTEGDPHISVVSPTGEVFREGDDNIIIERLSNKILLAVKDPAPGNWRLEVDNLKKESLYSIKAVGINKNPELDILTVLDKHQELNTNYTVSGKVKIYTESKPIITVYASSKIGSFTGLKIGDVILNESGEFDIKTNLTILSNNEYYLYVGLNDGINPEFYKHISGSIILNNNFNELEAIDDLVINRDEQYVNISFSDNYPNRSKGFYLTINNLTTDIIESIDLGYLTSLSLSTLNPGDIYEFSIIPYNVENEFGPVSNVVLLEIESKVYNPDNNFLIKYQEHELTIGDNSTLYIDVIPETTNLTDDYTEVIISGSPSFLDLNIKHKRLSLKEEGSYQIDLLFNQSKTDVLPGIYYISGIIKNVNNVDVFRSFKLEIIVKEPSPIVTNFSPKTWHIDDNTTIFVKGSGFTKSTKAYIDDTLCIVNYTNSKTLKIYAPKLSKQNSGELKILNSDALYTIKDVELIKPSIKLEHLKYKTKVNPKNFSWFYSRINRINRFNDEINISIENSPINWIVTNSIDGDIISTKIYIPENTIPDVYSIKLKVNEIDVEYFVEVVKNIVKPHISTIYDNIIYGFGFNPQSRVYMDNKECDVLNYKNDTLTFSAGTNEVDGIVKVQTLENVSNSIKYTYITENFNLYAFQNNFYLLPNETIKGKLYISGYSNSVDINIINDNIGISVTVLNKRVKLNGSTLLSISVGPDIKPGNYKVILSGNDGFLIKEKTLNITVGKQLKLESNKLKNGKLKNLYNDKIIVNSENEIILFELFNNSYLPEGLQLDSLTGNVFGIPKEIGTFNFSIRVNDIFNKFLISTLTIIIDDDGWYQREGPINNNRYSNTISPAEYNLKWVSESNNNSELLLSSGDFVYSISDDILYCINKYNGIVKLRSVGHFSNPILSSNYIFSLSDGIFRIYNIKNGELLTEIPKIKRYSSIRNFILLESENNYIKFSLDTFEYVITSDSLVNINKSSSFETEYNDIKSTLNFDGKYIEYRDNNIIKEFDSGITNGKIVINDKFLVIYNSSQLLLVNRLDETQLYTNMEISELILTSDKLFTIDSYGLNSWNLYTLNKIWNSSGNFISIISNDKNIYALNNSGEVECYSGRNNIYKPNTTYDIYPELPDGLNDYYKSIPEVTFTSKDIESKSSVSINKKSIWEEITKPIILLNGSHNILYRSKDTMGLIEDVRLLNVKVDFELPVIEYNINIQDNRTLLNLSGTDKISGINKMEYSINGSEYITYKSEILFSTLGSYLVSFRSIDNAGNIGVVKNCIINIGDYDMDLTETIVVKFNEVDNTLSLESSNIDLIKIEYSFTNNIINTYKNVIELQKGLHTIQYRGISTSGDFGVWKTYTLNVIGIKQFISNINTDSKNISFSKVKSPQLPNYLQGAIEILGFNKDTISMRAESDINMFIIVDSKIEVDFTWEVIESYNSYKILKKKYIEDDYIEFQKGISRILIAENIDNIITIDVPSYFEDLNSFDRIETNAVISASSWENANWFILDSKNKILQTKEGLNTHFKIPQKVGRYELCFKVEINNKTHKIYSPIIVKYD
ncbi:MAG: IPT/TIG domain-containing protein [Spirochaetaceae bacterium]